MYILGIATMTDSSAVLLKDNEIIGAVEEERFTRIKHQKGMPVNAIKYLLAKEKIKISDIDICSVYWKPWNIMGRAKYLFTQLLNIKLFIIKFIRSFQVFFGQNNSSSGWFNLFFLKYFFKKNFNSVPRKIIFFDHHECHIASSFFISGFKECASIVMDGAGEYACTTLSYVKNNKIENIKKFNLPHSLGHFYSSVTGFLGFKMLEDEYKVMGLSSYGEPTYVNWIEKNILISNNESYYINNNILDYHSAFKNKFSSSLIKKFGSQRQKNQKITKLHKDIANSAQKAFENVLIKLAKFLKNKTKANNLIISGGCGLNCTANGVISDLNIFDKVFIPPAPHDAGAALGSAFMALSQNTNISFINKVKFSPYLGPSYSNKEIHKCLISKSVKFVQVEDLNKFLNIAVDEIIKEKVICWFQGASEFGPRALGNRSFLADPRDDKIVSTMNQKIKQREEFRPFAPSIKSESYNDYFISKSANEFMTVITNVKPNIIDKIPAVVHIDKTARPQVVYKDNNEIYWSLINAFEQKTNIPLLLNTSFNIQEPIVNSPDEAIDTFLKSNVKKLFINKFVVYKDEF